MDKFLLYLKEQMKLTQMRVFFMDKSVTEAIDSRAIPFRLMNRICTDIFVSTPTSLYPQNYSGIVHFRISIS